MIVITASFCFHITSLVIANTLMLNWRWQHLPVHSAVEVSGGFIALLVSYMLLNLQNKQRGTSFNIIIASALGTMGLLDIAHALVEPGRLFVWLHSLATFLGGLLFVLVWIPKSSIRFSFPFVSFCFIFTLLTIILSFYFPHQIPVMVSDGTFTFAAQFLNTSGGILLLISSVKLLLVYREKRKVDDLLFVLHASMFGLAAIMFQQSALWDFSWWGWHILRFFAYGVALWFAFKNEQHIFTEIETSNQTLTLKAKENDKAFTALQYQHDMSEKQQAAILACLNDAIIVTNNTGIIKFFSESAEQMFGYYASQVLGKNVNILMNQEFAKNHHQNMANYTHESRFKIVGVNRELKAINKSGHEFPIDLVISALVIEGIQHFVGVIRDITVKKEQECKLNRAIKEAESASDAKSLFLANTSHEIRTPLNGIYGNLQLLLKENLSDNAEQYLNRALHSSKTLMTIINDLLDFSKIEASKLTIEDTEFTLSTLIKNTVSDFIPLTKAKNIALSVSNNVVHDHWNGDPTRIQQVLLNVISNAVKFTLSGKVAVEISCNSTCVVFSVSDTGIGMDEIALEKLFARFEQADASTTRQYGGTGIGMSITKSLVELMHGDISVSSKKNVGTTFTISLPLKKVTKPILSEVRQTDIAIDFSGKKILIAEDNSINQEVVKAMLQDSKAQVDIVENGEEAVARFNSSYDLILLDIQMPIMDGLEAIKQLHKKGAKLPIIALTANIMEEDIKKYEKAGFTDYIGKPVDKNYLLSKISKYLN